MIDEKINIKIKQIFNGSYTAQVYFVLRKQDEFVIKLADIEDKDEPELREMFSSELIKNIVNDENLKICLLSSADEYPNAIYLYDYDTYPEELGLFKDFDIDTAIHYDKFNFDEDRLSDLFGYIIYLGSMSNGISLFKKHYPISLIKQDSFLLGIKKDKERFIKIPASDIIRLNGKAQLLKIKNKIYVMDLKMLERNMGFTMLIKKVASESIDSIAKLNIIEDIQTLTDSLDNISFVKKLSKIKNTSPIFKLNINAASIIQFTKSTDVLRDKFKYTEDGKQLRLDTKKSKQDFLALMNDEFLISELTRQYYEATSKDDLQ